MTDGLSDATDPVFDRGGEYLYFLASTDAGPVVNWFDLSNADMEMTRSIYLVTLQKETPSPLAREREPQQGKRMKRNLKRKRNPGRMRMDPLKGLMKKRNGSTSTWTGSDTGSSPFR